MNESRRNFLRAAGITILGVGGAAPVVASRLGRSQHEPAPEASHGQRYALAIDTTKCASAENCGKACMAECHRLHNVPEVVHENGSVDHEEEIKWIWEEHVEHALHEHVSHYASDELRHREIPVLCNHCDNPPCVRVCPTKATFKRADGPVMMDQHRCIGCRFCIVGCPYGARSFNWKDPREFFKPDEYSDPVIPNPSYPTRTKGVVEKCTMCTERLAIGLKPACAEACPEKAILFGDLENPDDPQFDQILEYIQSNFTVRRKAELGTRPQVHYKL